jgi:hypothetical protein
MAMHAVHVVSRQPRTVVILSPQLLADPAASEAFRRRAQQTAGRREDGVADLVDVGTEGSITYSVI